MNTVTANQWTITKTQETHLATWLEAFLFDRKDRILERLEQARGSRPGQLVPGNVFSNEGFQIVAALFRLGRGVEMSDIILHVTMLSDCLLANRKAAPVAASSNQQFGGIMLHSDLERLFPVLQRLKRVVLLRVDDQQGQGSLVHVELMD